MAKPDLKNMDVNALLTLRADVEKVLVERSRDLQRQLVCRPSQWRILRPNAPL